jgi:hypothetical protein
VRVSRKTGGRSVRVHVGDAKLVRELLEYFDQQADCVAIQVGETDIEVSLLGSYGRAAHADAVDRLVAEFRLRHATRRRLHRVQSESRAD